MSILDEIVARKRADLPQAQRARPLTALAERSTALGPQVDFSACLTLPGVSVIAEVKKASPSKGLLAPDFDPVRLATTYAAHGARAISVLTDEPFFQGSLEHLAAARAALSSLDERPALLRKDFVVDAYQVHEARAYGADALLLIAAVLAPSELAELLALAYDLGLEGLVEVHDETEVETALKAGSRVIGINNRDLRTFGEDLSTTRRLLAAIPRREDVAVVSESAIRSPADVALVGTWGVDAVLIGEALVTAPDTAAALRALVAAGAGAQAP